MKKTPVFDGHNDTLVNLFLEEHGGGRSFFKESDKGQVDLPRTRKGGLIGGFFAIFTPPPESSPERDPYYGFTATGEGYDVKLRSALDHGYANDFTDSVIDLAYQLEKQSDGKVKIIRDCQELEWCIENDVLAVVLHFEGAAAIEKDLDDLKRHHQRGLRSLGLVHSRPNAFGLGVPYRFPHSPDTGSGLTRAGEKLVKECNELGIIIDLAHINERGFWDAARISKDPLVVSHAGACSLCPSTRNLTDAQIDAIGESGGVIGVIFEPANIRSDGRPDKNTPLTDIIMHIDHICERIGIDHAAFGSDFDGAEMPDSLRDVSYLPRLIDALRETGYDDDAVERLSYKNWLRVMRNTWKNINPC